MADGVDEANPLKPEVTGLMTPPADSSVISLYWKITDEDTKNRRVQIVLEIKNNDAAMVLVLSTAQFRFERLSSCSRTIMSPISFASSFFTEVASPAPHQSSSVSIKKKICQPATTI